MTASRLARALALLLAVMPLPAVAAGMPASGTKNFTPPPATPSYFSDERGGPEVGPQPPAASAPAAAAPVVAVTPPRPAVAPAYRSANRQAQARSFSSRTIRVRAVRPVRQRRLRAVRLAHWRPRHKPAARR